MSMRLCLSLRPSHYAQFVYSQLLDGWASVDNFEQAEQVWHLSTSPRSLTCHLLHPSPPQVYSMYLLLPVLLVSGLPYSLSFCSVHCPTGSL